MKRGKPLRAKASTTRAWQDRSRERARERERDEPRKPLPKFGAKALREQEAQAEFRRVIRQRSNGWCEGATPACPNVLHAGHHAHHVWPSDRDRGVHDPARGVFLCTIGHEWVHSHPTDAEARGLLGRSGG